MEQAKDHQFMEIALGEACRAFEEKEIPVGAVVVKNGQVVGVGRNAKEKNRDPTAHAEIVALREAASHLGRWRLTGCSVYVTLEPCPMCIGAMLSARINRLVFGCRDPKAGAAVSLVQLANDPRFNHRIQVEEGILATVSSQLLRDFFGTRRKEASKTKTAVHWDREVSVEERCPRGRRGSTGNAV